ncbi:MULTISPECIES: DUF6702 family protein [Thalassotalea]|uniref:DUF6702 family protein n=1 Tax=Thalassotalea TaxID=1518149 RepID=UPI000945C6F0|nr:MULTISPECIES: DUF6702 family protein [Thalassotalea]OKY25001.1 hypothetical protein BI291_17550 [Thalassotalea sp. PP2-459]
MKFITKSLIICLFLFSNVIFAHQQKAAISTVLFNPNTENIEVSHRFYLHDAEHAVKHIFGKNADIIQSKQTQQRFFEYVMSRFSLKDDKGNTIDLGPVGFEVDGKFFWVYQETKQPVLLSGLTIEHTALRDIWPSQTNTVNVEGKGDVKTATFNGSVEVAKIEFH